MFLFLFSSLLFAKPGSYVSIEDAKKTLDADIYWEPFTKELLFSKEERSASLSLDSSFILYANMSYAFFENSLKLENNAVHISHECLASLASYFNTEKLDIQNIQEDIYHNDMQGYRVGAILIDPGHGGKDAGAVDSYVEGGKTHIVYEKNIALTVSLDLYKRLKTAYPDKKIELTRDGDYYPTLPQRVKKANSIKVKKNEAVLYISIHANASLNNRAHGFEVWYLPPEYRRTVIEKNEETKDIHAILNSMLEEEYTMESILMSKYVLDGLDKAIGHLSRNRGIKEEEYIVVKNVKMPSILIELGFVTNKEEAKRLSDPYYLKKCAEGIYNGLQSFIYQFESSRGFIAN